MVQQQVVVLAFREIEMVLLEIALVFLGIDLAFQEVDLTFSEADLAFRGTDLAFQLALNKTFSKIFETQVYKVSSEKSFKMYSL